MLKRRGGVLERGDEDTDHRGIVYRQTWLSVDVDYCYIPQYAMLHAIMSSYRSSHLDLVVPSAALYTYALLRTDLGVLLDGDVFVGLEC
jgi:hypothetical protein